MTEEGKANSCKVRNKCAQTSEFPYVSLAPYSYIPLRNPGDGTAVRTEAFFEGLCGLLGRPLKAGGLHRLIKSHINYWHFPELRLKRTCGSLSSHVLPGVSVARRQAGLGLIACLFLSFGTGCLICPKTILRVQLLQSLGKNVSWNQDHLFKEKDSSKPGKFKYEVSTSMSGIIALYDVIKSYRHSRTGKYNISMHALSSQSRLLLQ